MPIAEAVGIFWNPRRLKMIGYFHWTWKDDGLEVVYADCSCIKMESHGKVKWFVYLVSEVFWKKGDVMKNSRYVDCATWRELFSSGFSVSFFYWKVFCKKWFHHCLGILRQVLDRQSFRFEDPVTIFVKFSDIVITISILDRFKKNAYQVVQN